MVDFFTQFGLIDDEPAVEQMTTEELDKVSGGTSEVMSENVGGDEMCPHIYNE